MHLGQLVDIVLLIFFKYDIVGAVFVIALNSHLYVDSDKPDISALNDESLFWSWMRLFHSPWVLRLSACSSKALSDFFLSSLLLACFDVVVMKVLCSVLQLPELLFCSRIAAETFSSEGFDSVVKCPWSYRKVGSFIERPLEWNRMSMFVEFGTFSHLRRYLRVVVSILANAEVDKLCMDRRKRKWDVV